MLNFDTSKDYLLEDDFARLRPLTIDDVPLLQEIANEPNIWDYSFQKGDGVANLTAYIQTTLDNRKEGKDYPFIIFDKTQNEYAGSTRFCEIIPSLDIMRLGFTWIGKKFRGTGLNKHCKYLLFEFAFETMGGERIGMASYAENKRSIAAMESVGVVREGIFRGIFPAVDGNGRTDAVMLSILKEDWFGKVKEELGRKLI